MPMVERDAPDGVPAQFQAGTPSPLPDAVSAEALETIGPGNGADALDALKGDYYRKVREAASKALAKISPEAKK